MTNIPVFNNFNLINDGIQISPFLHFNLLLTPYSQPDVKHFHKQENDRVISENPNPIRISAGFGLSLVTQAFGIEMYYNAYLKKEIHDIGSEFFIKFGID